jgi:hypothetical protein
MGGMFGESKYEVLNLIPEQYKPKAILVKHPLTAEALREILHRHNLTFPLVFKPDMGERGFMVKRIFTEQDIQAYVSSIQTDFLVQELIDWPVECGVFYTRLPNEENGKVTSVVLKEMLTVTGNGKSTLQELILAKPRAKLQWEKLCERFADKLTSTIPDKEEIVLNSIGNHCLGTTFLDGTHLINNALHQTFDTISKQIHGFYFGRFDLRCQSINDLYTGNIKIMELNGCGAEPAHVYHPGYSLLKALSVFYTHWHNMFTISMQNRKRGATFTSLREGIKHYKKFKATVR